ncbi:unnamed protein product [Sphagnum jensenii]|uniref:Probable magnesium transporter n=1 Tax=Sphagnum jensenii TaxID=128206 RepID=A0ABP1B4K4_9BRYO
MWEAVALTVAAAAGNNIGKVLQKQGTKGLPQLSLDLKYGASRTWVTGVAVDIAGAVLMLKAVSQAPVSIVQPVSGCGLAVLAVFSHFYLHEAMHGLDWLGVAMAATGTVAVGATAEGQKNGHISVIRLLLFFSWLALFFGVLDWWARSGKRRHQKLESLESQLVLSVNFIFPCPTIILSPCSLSLSLLLSHNFTSFFDIYCWNFLSLAMHILTGMEAGACFGLSATVCKIGFILAESGMSRWFVPAGIAVGVCCSGSGFFCQTRGLKDGRAVVVSTCAAVASIVIGVLMGLFALGESLPGSSFGRYLLLLAWTLIVLGIIVVLLSEKLGPMLPRSLRKILKPKSSMQQKVITRSGAGTVSRRDLTGNTSVNVMTVGGSANGQLKIPASKYRPSD